ncbi:MAG: GNAT family N-acetyltransferase [Proteobacteria bacterium]|nr:GNAT family N-acetyltransferase [Pseudomonadota bacterium]
MRFAIRPIQSRDDADVAAIIRAVMSEFGADGPGFALHDAEVDAMHDAYARADRAYFVVESGGRVRGGGGIAPLDAEPGVCELRKMYFLPELRGRGAGDALIRRCLDAARTLGYRRCYLETLTGMDAAQRLYERHGFTRIPAALGNTGHFGCNRFYLLDL